jgi:hypothetical protein
VLFVAAASVAALALVGLRHAPAALFGEAEVLPLIILCAMPAWQRTESAWGALQVSCLGQACRTC